MNAEQKQRALDLIDVTKTYRLDAEECAMQMAALLQELANAPEPDPFGYFKSEPFGWTDCAETDDGAIALYTAPPAPSVPDEELQAAFDRGLKAGNEQKESQQVEIHRLHDLLAAAPTPAEAPEDVAPEPEPVAYATGYYAGYLSIATVDGRVLPAGTALYAAPPAPSVPDGWRETLGELANAVSQLVDERYPKHSRDYAFIKRKFNRYKNIIDSARAMLAAPTSSEAPADVARDAARYRWLLKQAWFQQAAYRFDLPDGGLQKRFEKCMDEFIDAAIERQGGQP